MEMFPGSTVSVVSRDARSDTVNVTVSDWPAARVPED